MHCPGNTEVVFKEIKDSFGIRLRLTGCDLNLIRGISQDDELKNESPARVRRIKRRRTKIASTETEF